MELIRITELTKQLGLSSRTLRYYEQAGLIASIRPQFETLRYYDDAAVQRLRQIIILRKMQIPVKDIIRIYENPEMTTVVEVFTGKLREIDRDVTALSELKRIIDAFLQNWNNWAYSAPQAFLSEVICASIKAWVFSIT